jgi:hypothetical protein
MSGISGRQLALALSLIVLLTLSTSYIHFWVGGTLLLLNSAGYLGLAILVVGSAAFYRRALPLVLLGLAAYALVTILGWLVMGPYFDLAYLAKAIEIVLITTIGIVLSRMRPELRNAISWARSLPAAAYRLIR